MKERPILFSGEMVRAILDGRKTQTRRVLTGDFDGDFDRDGWPLVTWPSTGCLTRATPRYGGPGDRLWVRETWGVDAPLDDVRRAYEDVTGGSLGASVYYRADRVHENTGLTWKPSIHMPRWASRIILEITNIRVERVQDISQTDVMAEGTQGKRSFANLWDSINAARGYGWDANPWVWVVEFRRV